jgi:colanic acid/amylovoran biosynthesis protein
VRKALHIVASQFSAPLVPVPISRHSDPGNEDPDSVAIQKLIKGYSVSVDGGYHLDTPLKVIENVSLCRVVVTASYHAAVFALSQGIPVVALAKSEYYVDKFLGLIDQFGVGCEVIFLSDQHLEEKLIESIRQKWSKADSLRAELLTNAKHQVELGQAAYKRLYELVSSH